MALDPALRALLDQLASAPAPPAAEQSVEMMRTGFEALAALSGPPVDVAAAEDRTAGGVPVRVYTPLTGTAPRPVVVWFHGGGFVIGSLDSYDALCRRLADSTGTIVVSVDYRLAPEHPFPAGPDDCYSATAWVADHAEELGGDAARIAVAGDSAGGNLAAVTALLARDQGGPALAAQVLVYPVTDLTMSHPSIAENGEGYLLTADTLRWFYAHYLGSNDPKEPLASPLHAGDLAGLPPALVITAEFDPLRDEGEAYAERMRESGGRVTASRYDGMIHFFVSLGLVAGDGSNAATAEIAAFLSDAFG